ncbi:Protein kinase, ATP binding site-containing protein [Cynara cardunculus var. scolymus]|uniref:Protein kinase, ATP binding site-containing protein n=1 Tax=Cynara cardunculus var. scolymus TaxID=59895 RepID=A0A103YK14_CYNCS|nr:Protein kinase, ATP binding site-containing protein [Cynara cardunculus var. scolymus]
MGCVCGKPSAIEDSRESPRDRYGNKISSELRVPRVTSSRREVYRVKTQSDNSDGGSMLIDKQVNGSIRLPAENFERKRDKPETIVSTHHPSMGSVPRATEGEQVAAGWPPWLAAVAGEAIKGWVPRRADSFEKLDKIGQGTYSNVYRARDLDQGKIVALKKVRFDNLEPESVRFMAREIHILRRLDHPNVIKLEGLVTSRMSCSLYLVFEYMEHDLAGLASHPALKFTESQVKCYIRQLLHGLNHCHSHGILHRDIKGSNLLVDNNGVLKIADFGLASFFDPHQSQPLTSRVVTLWYRPPELLLGATYYGIAVDLWSTGCIFFATKPLPCDPSSLPKYPPSKEFDAKMRDEEARRYSLVNYRQAAAGGKVHRPDAERRGTRESRAIPAPEANAELVVSMQKRQGQSYSRSEKFNPQQEESASGFPIDPPRPSQTEEEQTNNLHKRASHSGPLVQRPAWSKVGKKIDSNGSDLSGSLAARKSMLCEDRRDRDKSGTSQQQHPRLISRFPGSLKEASSHGAGQPDDDGRSSNKDPISIHYSGPLLAPAGKMDQMLKDHDRQIQDAVRRARDKTKVRKVQAENTFFSGR